LMAAGTNGKAEFEGTGGTAGVSTDVNASIGVYPLASAQMAKGLFAEGDFLEVWLDTPAEVVVERDPKGLYAKAKAGTLPNMTGVGQGYEPPEHPDVTVNGAGEVADAVAQLLDALEVAH